MTRTIIYKISEEDSGLSIEKYLRKSGYTRQNITELKKGVRNVLIKDEWVHVNRILQAGEELTIIVVEEKSSEKIPPVNIDFSVLYEDEDILVVNKPANMPVHPSLNNYENTLGNAVAYYIANKSGSDGNFVYRCINRLDRDTTGAIIIAKHYIAAGILHGQMASRKISRQYIAIVEGIFEDKEGKIDAPIGRKEGSSIERCIDYDSGEKAITNYKVINEFGGMSLLSLKLETGRTHQIRVHMKHIGHPLIGDFLYNPNNKLMNRQALHSYSIDFTHPITREHMSLLAPMPEDMKAVVEKNYQK